MILNNFHIIFLSSIKPHVEVWTRIILVLPSCALEGFGDKTPHSHQEMETWLPSHGLL